MGIQTCPGNPFDGHTLEGQLDQVERLTGRVPGTTFVDRGYQGHGVDPGRSRVLISGTRKLGYALRRHLRRRAAIEPEIGHMKGDGLLGRNFLKGMAGDAINALLCGAGHNLRKILARLRALLYLLTGKDGVALSSLLGRIGPLSESQRPYGRLRSSRGFVRGDSFRRPGVPALVRLSGPRSNRFSPFWEGAPYAHPLSGMVFWHQIQPIKVAMEESDGELADSLRSPLFPIRPSASLRMLAPAWTGNAPRRGVSGRYFLYDRQVDPVGDESLFPKSPPLPQVNPNGNNRITNTSPNHKRPN